MSQPFKLFRLQQVDSQLDQAHGRIAEINAILADNEAVQAARTAQDQADGALQESQRELKNAEDEVKAQEIKIEQNQSVLYSGSVKNPKELQDLELESEALKRYLATLEDRQLEKMLAYEDSDTQQKAASGVLERVLAEVAQQNKQLTNERQALLNEATRLESERQAAVDGIEPDDLALYEKLRGSRGGLAVAKVADKICSACGTTLSAALAQAARSPNKISRCDTCGRILYAG